MIIVRVNHRNSYKENLNSPCIHLQTALFYFRLLNQFEFQKLFMKGIIRMAKDSYNLNDFLSEICLLSSSWLIISREIKVPISQILEIYGMNWTEIRAEHSPQLENVIDQIIIWSSEFKTAQKSRTISQYLTISRNIYIRYKR